MGQLKASYPGAATSKITVSMWVRVNTGLTSDTDGLYGEVVDIGTSGGNGTGFSIFMRVNRIGHGVVSANLTGNTVDLSDSLTVISGTPISFPPYTPPPATPFFSATNSNALPIGGASANIWIHIMLAADTSGVSECNASGNFVSGNTLKLYVNKVPSDTVQGYDVTFDSPPRAPITIPFGSGWPQIIDEGGGIVPSDWTGDIYPKVINNNGGAEYHYRLSIPAWTMNIGGGQEIGIPTITDFLSFNWQGFAANPTISFAECQIWIGTYIDPQIHLSKFIDAGGHPVNPSVPQAAFGSPTVLLRRNKLLNKRFEKNEGTLGDVFVKTGTFNDYKPGP